MNDRPEVIIWTDGGCVPNPGKGGWGVLLEYDGNRKLVGGNSGNEETTNNRCELMAIITALEALNRPCKVCVISDSQYAISIASGVWKAKSNFDLVERLLTVAQDHEIGWIWKKEFSTPEMYIVHARAEAEARKAGVQS